MTKARLVFEPGQRFGRWTVLGPGERPHSAAHGNHWLCRCDCGNERAVSANSLSCGNSRSCGCYKVEVARAIIKRNKTHGMTDTIEYSRWSNMIGRCECPSNNAYSDYGGRGIAVCERWRRGDGERSGFECFFADMGPVPDGLSLDRRDVNGNYSPDNCRWADKTTQANNKRPKRKAIPDLIKLLVVLRQNARCTHCSERLGDNLSSINFDHRPPISTRAIAKDATDYVPAQLDPEYIEALHVDCHSTRTHGPGNERRITTRGGDIGDAAHIRRVSAKHQEFRSRLLRKEHPEWVGEVRKRKIPSRPFPKKPRA